LLFHHNPERYFFGAFVKIGYFENDADLIYQDEFHGSLITMADQIVDTIYRKYFKGIIIYEGILRITDYPVPRPALREAIFNAIVHRDYATGVPIQIKVFPDCVIVYNDDRLPEDWTVANLLKRHKSRPYDPKIAYSFYRAGFIETWGRGIERIRNSCKEAGKRDPLFEASHSEISVTFFTDVVLSSNSTLNGAGGDKDTINETVSYNDTINDTQINIIKLFASNPYITSKAISSELRINERNVKRNIKALKEAGFLERVGPNRGGNWVVKLPE
jgi:ATP-dependent DNA helicase RecG